MKILHGTWIPDAKPGFVQTGAFYLWIETDEADSDRYLSKAALSNCLIEELGFPLPQNYDLTNDISPKAFTLPAANKQPLPSLELARYLELEIPNTFEWQSCKIDCYRVGRYAKANQTYVGISTFIAQIKELHFIAQYQLADVQLGSDLLFWFHYTQAFKQVILKDHYIPSLRYRNLPARASSADQKASKSASKRASQKKAPQQKLSETFETYPHWEIVSEAYEETLQRYLDYMPVACTAGFAEPSKIPQLYDKETLLRHCSECLLHDVVTRTPLPQGFYKKIEGSLIYSCLKSSHWTTNTELTLYKQWRPWRDRIAAPKAPFPSTCAFSYSHLPIQKVPGRSTFKLRPKPTLLCGLPCLTTGD